MNVPSLVPDWAPNIHPLIVHFPIAWWIGAVLVDVIAVAVPRAVWAGTTASILYSAGALSATAAFFSGRQAQSTVHMAGMAHPLLLEHWNWALVTTVLFVVLTLVRLLLRFRHPERPRWVHRVLAIAALVALGSLFETGERGARLVFEHGVGVASHGPGR